MRKSLVIALLLPLCAVFSGCGGREDVTTPVACLGSAAEWRQALGALPGGPVSIGGTPLSDCLPADQPAGQQETVGRTAVEVATGLVRRTRVDAPPAGVSGSMVPVTSAYAAGYLVGALERGASRSQGIHATLVERVRSAASNGLDARPEGVRDAWTEGYETGLESG